MVFPWFSYGFPTVWNRRPPQEPVTGGVGNVLSHTGLLVSTEITIQSSPAPAQGTENVIHIAALLHQIGANSWPMNVLPSAGLFKCDTLEFGQIEHCQLLRCVFD